MNQQIDVTDINSVEAAKKTINKAIKTGDITEEKAKFLAIAFDEIKREKNEYIEPSDELSEQLPELESENHKIPSLSQEQKSKMEIGQEIDGRKKEKDSNGVIYLQKDFTPEETDPKNKAYVWEVLAGMPQEFIGEQKFTQAAVDKLGLRNKMIKNWKQLKKIQGEMSNKDFANKYFSKNGKLYLSGYWNPFDERFQAINIREDFWLGEGPCVGINEKNILPDGNDPRFGCSVRCFKSA